MSLVKKENGRKEILESVRRFVQESEEKQRVQMITDALGDRRDRDLFDILSQIEQERGWSETIDHLILAKDFKYSLPVGAGPIKLKPEEIKFRESVFLFFACTGLEPVPIATENLLTHLRDADSFVDASRMALNHLEPLVAKQVESGDTLFFDSNFFDNSISRSLIDLIEDMQQEQIQNITLKHIDNEYNILPLWHNEIGRRVLSMIGIKGNTIDSEQLDIVLSVIHQPLKVTEQPSKAKENLLEPSNEIYRKLLISMISHDIDNICVLSSRLAYPITKAMLEESLDCYEKDSTSEKYRNILAGINTHVRIRAIDSISFMEQLAQSENSRIATAAITALGNFYHESAVSVLVDILCNTKKQEIIRTASSAIVNISKRCPETRFVITSTLESNSCDHSRHLKRLQKEIEGKRV